MALPLFKKDRHFKGFGRFLKIDSTSSTYLWNWSSATLETREPLSLQTLMESNFDSNLWTLSMVVLPTVKYQGSLPISTSMISMVASMDSMADKSCLKRFSEAVKSFHEPTTDSEYWLMVREPMTSKRYIKSAFGGFGNIAAFGLKNLEKNNYSTYI